MNLRYVATAMHMKQVWVLEIKSKVDLFEDEKSVLSFFKILHKVQVKKVAQRPPKNKKKKAQVSKERI